VAQSKYFRPMYPMRPYRAQRPRIASGGGGGGGGAGIESGIANLMKAIQAKQAQAKLEAANAQQDVIANQLYNTRFAPRAAYVPGVDAAQRAVDAKRAGVSPATVNALRPTVMTAGTAPMTGGMAELQARVQIQRLMNELDPNAVRSARTAAALGARGPVGPAAGSRSGWARQAGGGGGRTRAPAGGGGGAAGGKAAPVDTSAPQNPAKYNFDTLRKQFDSQYGKIANYDAVSPYFNNIHPQYDPNDPKQKPPDTGLWANAKGGLDFYQDGKLKTSLLGNQADYWRDRINTALSNAGQDPVPTTLPGSGKPSDPYVLNNSWQRGSVPFGSAYTTTDSNKVILKLRPEDAQKAQFAQAVGGNPEDYSTSFSDAMGGKTTGPDLPAPTPVAPERGGAGYSASFGAQGAAPDAGLAFGPAPNDQAYTSRFNPPVQPPTPDDQAYTARFNPQIPPPVASPPMVPITAESVGIPPSAGSSGAASYYDSAQGGPQPGIDPNLLMGGT
jgi:hypothetical protein